MFLHILLSDSWALKRKVDDLCLFLQICSQHQTKAWRGILVCCGPAPCRVSTVPLQPDQNEGSPLDVSKWPSGCSSWVLDCPPLFSLYKLLFVLLPAPWVGIHFCDAEAGKTHLKGASLVNEEREEKKGNTWNKLSDWRKKLFKCQMNPCTHYQKHLSSVPWDLSSLHLLYQHYWSFMLCMAGE